MVLETVTSRFLPRPIEATKSMTRTEIELQKMTTIGHEVRQRLDVFLAPNILRDSILGNFPISHPVGDYDVYYPDGLEGNLILSYTGYNPNRNDIEVQEIWYSIDPQGHTQEFGRTVGVIDKQGFEELQAGLYAGHEAEAETFLTKLDGFDPSIKKFKPDPAIFTEIRDSVLIALNKVSRFQAI